MAGQRKVVPSPDLWGWTGTVEATRLTERGAIYSVDRVYLDGEAVGFVVGRHEGRTGKMWDYVVGDRNMPTPRPSMWRLVFGFPGRQHAVAALVEKASRA